MREESARKNKKKSVMPISGMNEMKKILGYSYEMIAEKSGLPISTVQKVLGGITKSPRYETLRALEKVFTEYDLECEDYNSSMVAEEQAHYNIHKKQGDFNIDDWSQGLADKLIELIDGIIYEVNTPTTYHQLISSHIFNTLFNYISRNNGECMPFSAPTGVQLDNDDKTMVIPDIFIVCSKDKINKNWISGAPDFIVEILSESTRNKDMHIKLNKYQAAGVREYWTVDPLKKKIIVNDFMEDDVFIYSFNDSVPVRIYEGKCEIDFSEIKKYIAFLI